MSIFRDLQRKAGNLRARKQSEYYRRVVRDTKLAGLKKAKLERMQEAKRKRARLQAEVRDLTTQSKKKRGKFRLPKLVGDFGKLTAGMPSDEELNKAVFGNASPKLPDDIARLERGPSKNDLDQLSKDIFR